jgi:hypothetical protein
VSTELKDEAEEGKLVNKEETNYYRRKRREGKIRK